MRKRMLIWKLWWNSRMENFEIFFVNAIGKAPVKGFGTCELMFPACTGRGMTTIKNNSLSKMGSLARECCEILHLLYYFLFYKTIY